MKLITYRVAIQSPTYGAYSESFEVRARSINSGFPKALRLALRGLPLGHELVSVTFWTVA